MSGEPFDLDAAMKQLGLQISDIVKLTGRNRITVWRWRKTKRCPVYVQKLLATWKVRRKASAR